MTKITNITSIVQFAQLATMVPSIVNFPGFSPLRDVIAALKNATGCRCGGKRDLTNYRPQFEAGMAVLSTAEQQQFKTLLQTEQVCYYSTSGDGRLKKICF